MQKSRQRRNGSEIGVTVGAITNTGHYKVTNAVLDSTVSCDPFLQDSTLAANLFPSKGHQKTMLTRARRWILFVPSSRVGNVQKDSLQDMPAYTTCAVCKTCRQQTQQTQTSWHGLLKLTSLTVQETILRRVICRHHTRRFWSSPLEFPRRIVTLWNVLSISCRLREFWDVLLSWIVWDPRGDNSITVIWEIKRVTVEFLKLRWT